MLSKNVQIMSIKSSTLNHFDIHLYVLTVVTSEGVQSSLLLLVADGCKRTTAIQSFGKRCKYKNTCNYQTSKPTWQHIRSVYKQIKKGFPVSFSWRILAWKSLKLEAWLLLERPLVWEHGGKREADLLQCFLLQREPWEPWDLDATFCCGISKP